MEWESKLDKLLKELKFKEDIIGVLVCGSYITGNPSSHSDLDVHLILSDKVKYRQRGNKTVDGLLIEYFANPPMQIRKYFEEDYNDFRTMSLVQFITGKIISDETGIVNKLKKEAQKYMDKGFDNIDVNINELDKYSLWDKLDDLQDMFEYGREDFDFVYYVYLDKLISMYMKYIKYPYNKKAILGNINSPTVRKKYLLKNLPDKKIASLIEKCITTVDKRERVVYYEELTEKVLSLFGGFDINKFEYKSKLDL